MCNAAQRVVFLETFGCQMNVLDSELVKDELCRCGYGFTDDRDKADVILYNTCSVRAGAEDKVYARLGDTKVIKHRRSDVVVGVLGCMAEREGEGLVERFGQVDLMCGPGELSRLPELIEGVMRNGVRQFALEGHRNRRLDRLDGCGENLELLDMSRSFSASKATKSAYVRITRGCNKFCSYCVVPFTRGAEIHRPPEHIIDECGRLADAGVVEVTLLGQTVNRYRYDHGAAEMVGGIARPQIGPGGAVFENDGHRLNVGRRVTSFADLLKRVHDEVSGIKRLRFVTSFPRDFGDDILKVMAESERICDYIHLPAQSGSNRILKMMNRGYTVESYIDLVDRARRYLPRVMLASDFIVGFPTESDDDFEKTVELVSRCEFKNSFIFKYSPRPGTMAITRLEDDVPEAVKRARNVRLLEVQGEVSDMVHGREVGKVVEVFVEGLSAVTRKEREQKVDEESYESGYGVGGCGGGEVQLSGRTQGDLIVVFDGCEEIVGGMVKVRIDRAKGLTLFGELV